MPHVRDLACLCLSPSERGQEPAIPEHCVFLGAMIACSHDGDVRHMLSKAVTKSWAVKKHLLTKAIARTCRSQR